MKLFADDAKLYTEIGVNDNSLQRSLNNLLIGSSQLILINAVFYP
jgi:hypothetical protein